MTSRSKHGLPPQLADLASGLLAGNLEDIYTAQERISAETPPPASISIKVRTRTISYLAALSTTLRKDYAKSPGSPPLNVDLLRDAWPNVCLWIQKVYNSFSDVEDYKNDDWDLMTEVVKMIFQIIVCYPGMRQAILSKTTLTQVIGLLTHLWTLEGEGRVSVMPIASYSATIALRAVLGLSILKPNSESPEYEPDLTFFSVFSNRFEHPKDLVRLLLTHLNNAVNKHADFEYIMASVEVMSLTLARKSDDISREFVSQTPIKLILSVLDWAAESKGPMHSISHIVERCLGVIDSSRSVTNGTIWYCQLLAADILPIIFRCHRFYDAKKNPESSAYILKGVTKIIHLFTDSTFSRSLVGHAKRALHRLPSDQLHHPPFSGALLADWNTFTTLVAERVAFKTEYDLREWKRCFHPMCPSFQLELSKNSKLKACGGCQGVKYCSKACQKAHWPLHKRSCSPDNKPPATLAERMTLMALSYDDMRFLLALARRDVLTAKPQLIVQRKSIQSTSGTTLGSEIYDDPLLRKFALARIPFYVEL
ncbi:MYND-type domain-containing protein [Mycena indigotica]|uniref:MYND-type domain-containing protein n=1 Tax=Mycena indigotica TaxID=2126181 RepID=A0A8H6S628_9AGAR|nr:MYND-type domain-containing protein [Mycena indigotica]KAF7293077.1 MYND-type domain-containing protein [Mycena indigotica]